MNMVPTSEKHDATRSVVSSDLSWAWVNEATMTIRLLGRIVVVVEEPHMKAYAAQLPARSNTNVDSGQADILIADMQPDNSDGVCSVRSLRRMTECTMQDGDDGKE